MGKKQLFLERCMGLREAEGWKVGLGETPWCGKQHDQVLCVIICLKNKEKTDLPGVEDLCWEQ